MDPPPQLFLEHWLSDNLSLCSGFPEVVSNVIQYHFVGGFGILYRAPANWCTEAQMKNVTQIFLGDCREALAHPFLRATSPAFSWAVSGGKEKVDHCADVIGSVYMVHVQLLRGTRIVCPEAGLCWHRGLGDLSRRLQEEANQQALTRLMLLDPLTQSTVFGTGEMRPLEIHRCLPPAPPRREVCVLCFTEHVEILVCRLGKVGQPDLLPRSGTPFPLLSALTHCRCVASQLLLLCLSFLLRKACKPCHWPLSFARSLMHLPQGLCALGRSVTCFPWLVALHSVAQLQCQTRIVSLASFAPLSHFKWAVGVTGVKRLFSGQFPAPLQCLIAGIPTCVFL